MLLKQASSHGDPADGLPSTWREKLSSGKAWRRVGVTYRGGWAMIWNWCWRSSR